MKKKFVIGCTVVILALGIAYGTGAFYYKDKFFNGTSINGIDCGKLTAKEVEELIRKNVEGYSLELLFKEDRKEVVQGSEIAYEYVSDGSIAKLQEGTESFIVDNRTFWSEKGISDRRRN